MPGKHKEQMATGSCYGFVFTVAVGNRKQQLFIEPLTGMDGLHEPESMHFLCYSVDILK